MVVKELLHLLSKGGVSHIDYHHSLNRVLPKGGEGAEHLMGYYHDKGTY